jgi:hypothetical protein
MPTVADNSRNFSSRNDTAAAKIAKYTPPPRGPFVPGPGVVGGPSTAAVRSTPAPPRPSLTPFDDNDNSSNGVALGPCQSPQPPAGLRPSPFARTATSSSTLRNLDPSASIYRFTTAATTAAPPPPAPRLPTSRTTRSIAHDDDDLNTANSPVAPSATTPIRWL